MGYEMAVLNGLRDPNGPKRTPPSWPVPKGGARKVIPRRPTWQSPKTKLGPKFQLSRSDRWRLGGVSKGDWGASGSYTRLQVTFKISNNRWIVNKAKGITEEQLERWYAIQSGKLPKGDEVPEPMTDDELKEAALEEMKPLEAAAERETEELDDDALAEIRNLEAEIAEYEDDLDPDSRPNSLAKARRAGHKIELIQEELQVAKKRVAQRLNNDRAEIRDEYKRKQLEQIARAEDRVTELSKGLFDEIETAVLAAYDEELGGNGELDQYELI